MRVHPAGKPLAGYSSDPGPDRIGKQIGTA